MLSLRSIPVKRFAAVIVLALALTVLWNPSSARAAAGPITTSAQGARVNIGLLGILGVPSITLGLPAQQSWTTGGSTATKTDLGVDLLPGVNIIKVGAITATAQPATGGGRAQADVAGLNLLGVAGPADALNLGAIKTQCQMTSTGITGQTDIASLKVLGATVNPDVNLDLGNLLSGIATGWIDHRTADWNSSSGRLDYTIRAVDLKLLKGQGPLNMIANGDVVIAESVCSGIVKLGSVATKPVNLVPGNTATPQVTVQNTGDIAAPNTTITIPAPPAGYTVGTPTVTGSNGTGSCSVGANGVVTCTNVTVPGGGTVTVNLPVTLGATATNAADWSPTAGTITAVSTPVTGSSTVIPASGSGSLVAAQPAASTGGSITVGTPSVLTAGKTATTAITVANQGPSTATTTVTVPIGNAPAGVTVTSAKVGSTPCSVTTSAITCSGVSVPAGGTATINVATAATLAAVPGTVWTLQGMTANLNGTPIGGQGKFLTVGDPDVNLAGGVSITPANGIPGGGTATATVRVANSGGIAANPTTITLPAPPAGYTVGTVTTSNGTGTCTTTTVVRCTGVNIPSGSANAVTLSIPLTLAADVTANWAAAAGSEISAAFTDASGTATGTATGTIINVTPRSALGITATGPAGNTVNPGQTTSMAVNVYNQGPSDARNSDFVVVAPPNTTFGTLTAPTSNLCTNLTSTTLQCRISMGAGDPAVGLTLPLVVSAAAAPATPITGGCVSLDNDSACDGPTDKALPAINLRTPLSSRLTTGTDAATITPGTSGTGKLTLTSTQAETGVTVTIPTTGLPTGFSAGQATVAGGAGTCTTGAGAITCTGVTLTAGQAKDISVPITVASGVIPPQAWTPSGIVIATGDEQVTRSGSLAGTGTGDYTLVAPALIVPTDGTVEPGGTTSMQVAVKNNGPSDATNATFSVRAPAGTTFGTLSAPATPMCTLASSTVVTCTTTLAANAVTPTLTLPLQVGANTDPDKTVTGGCVDLDGTPGCAASDTSIPSFQLKVPFSVQATVTADRADVTPGSTATATLRVAAPHNDLSGVKVTIPLAALPAGLTVTGQTPAGCTRNATAVTCTGLAITKGTTADIGLTVAATSSSTAGTAWTASGIKVESGPDSITSNQELARVGAAQPVLTAAITLPPGTLLPGGTGNLDVAVSNTGFSDAKGAPVTVTAPLGAHFNPLNGATATTCTLSSDSRTATCSVDLAAGAPAVGLSFPLRVDATAAPGSTLTGGCVDLDGQPGCSATADKAIASITVGTPLQRRLTVTTTPAALTPGQNDTAQLTIKSTTTESGLTVTIPTTDLPAGVTASSATVPGGTCTVNASVIVCSPVNLPTAGQTVSVTLNTASLPSTLPGTWTAAGITVAKGTDTATASGDLAVVGQPQAAVTADATVPADGTVSAGGNADITVKVSNGGPSNATPATFVVRAPTGTTFAALPPNTASVCIVGPATVASCTVNLAANADTGNLIFPVVVPASADPFATISGGCVDLDGTAACAANDKVIPAITLKVPFDRRAAISATPATVTPGASATVKVRATALNPGDDLSTVTLTVPLAGLPAGLTVGTPSPGGCAKSGASPDTVVCSVPTISSGTPFEVSLPVSAAASMPAGTTWTATGIRLASGGESVTANRALATTGAGTFALNPTVTMPSGSIEPGGAASIGISLNNPGPSNATSAKIAYIAPDGTTFGTPTGPLAAGCTLVSPTRISCDTNLAGGATSTLTLPIVIDPSADPSKPVTGGCVDGNADGYCTSDPADQAFGSFALTVPFTQRVTVTTTPATVAPGAASGTTDILVSNSGNTALNGLTVTVPLPPVGSGVTLTPPVTCTISGSDITCTNVSVTGSGTTTIPITVDVAAGTPVTTAYAATVSVSDGTAANTVSTRRVLAGAGAPAYTLAAQLTGPPADTVLPGTTAEFTAVITNGGNPAALTAPVTITAPTGTTFGTLTGAAATACTAVNPTTLSCGVDVSVTPASSLAVTWTLPVTVPAGTTAPSLTGGCIDLDDDGTCATAERLPAIAMRKALSAVLALSGTPPTIVPGNTGSATMTLAASETRTGLVIGLDPAGLPAGTTVTGAVLGTIDCQVTASAVTCPATTIAAGATAALTVALRTGPSSPVSAGAGWSQPLTVTQGTETLTLHPTVAKIGTPVSSLTVALVVPDAGTLKPGTTGDMDVTLTNPGPSANPNARARFTAPTGTTFAALTGAAATLCTLDSPTEVSCGAALGVESKSFTLGINVPANADTDNPLTGGCVDANGDGSCTGGAGDRTIPDITLAKPFAKQVQLGINPLTVVPGTSGTATLTVAPDRPLTGISATVPLTTLPQGLTVVSVTGPAGSAATCTWVGAITCTGVDATTSTTNLVTVTVRAAASMTAGTVWAPNPVTLTSASGETAQVTGTLVRTGAPITGLSFDLTAPAAPVAPGSTATITATAANAGPSDASGLVARLLAPTGTIFGPLTGRAATDCTPVGTTQLDCRTDLPVSAAAAQWTVPVRIPANASPNATIGGGCIDLNRDGACAAAPADYPLPGIAVRATLDQAVTATADSPAIVPGRHGNVTVTLSATRAASGVTVTIPVSGLPSGVTVAPAQSTSGTCAAAVAGAITCTGVSVASGGTTTITLGADVAAGATPGQPPWKPTLTLVEAGVTAAKAVTSTLVGAADAKPVVSFTVPAAQSLRPGDSGAVQVTVTNQGTSVAKDVHYMFRAPSGTTFQPPTGTTASLCTRNVAGTVADCTVTVGGSAKVQFPLPLLVSPTADPASPVTGGCADVNLDNSCGGGSDVAVPAIQLGQPAGQLVISGTPGTVTPGSTATGQVRVTSAGPITGATVVVPLSSLPTGFTVTGATGPGSAFCTVSTTEVRCTGVALSTGTTTAVTITTRVAATVAPGVAWRATGVTVTAGSDSATGAADIATSGARVAAVTFRTTNAGATVKPGETTSMSVVATNAGPSDAVRKTVTVTAPANTTFGPLTGTAAQDCVISGSTATCTYDLDANRSRTYTVPLVVSSSVKNGDTLTGACTTADGTRTCGPDLTVSVDNTPANPSISRTGTLSLDSAVVAAGASGAATVRFSATTAHTGLTLTVPLGSLPDTFTVRTATVDGAACTVDASAITCTGVDLVAGQPKTLSIGVDVAATAAATAAWTATGITLADPKDADDKLTASGLLVSASRKSYSVGVTFGSPSNTAPLPGQTTTLPITFTNAGPDDAAEYSTTIKLPANSTAGTLPAGCAAGTDVRTIVCTVTLKAGESRLIQVPIVVGGDLNGGETLTGGCIDGVLGTDPTPDGECGGDADVSIPEFTLGRYKVNLAVTYNEPAVTVGPDATGVVVRIPYTNEGTDTADNVQFTIVPPPGVVVRAAAIELEDTTVSEGVVQAADEAQAIAAECVAAGGNAASNAVVCTAPDAAGLDGNSLLLTIDGSNSKKSGTQAMQVTISTTSADGNAQDNTVSVMLKLTAKAASGGTDGGNGDGGNGDGDDGKKPGGGKLPTTGAQIAGTALVSLMLIVAGATLLLAMRESRPAGAGPVRIPVRIPDHTPRHERPGILRRRRRRPPA
ncbi:hypothetical protein Aab01nite_14160 [Paractinoplanes abujensis]|uniref:Putative repeat protein (TIGR01451 family) n=1 Tax=Paractinoplanes abujensis TaxID=882441 RepID=A0A7W7G1L8_9ACTN|nr:hypothetical protein [Actinoplanes abujensis]MBB4690761.1 putative repeat protein (TIGR01451 family) [Actinoplanes abujensis]GID17826.1 hypothetical protein Aab01nite_14160 [Actinoplanes abujensis]